MQEQDRQSSCLYSCLGYQVWIGRDEKKGKTQEKMERWSRKKSSSAGNEKMERVGGR